MNSEYGLPIRYGLIGGMVMCVISVITYMFYAQLFSSLWVQMIFGLVTIAIMIFIPVWGTVSFKHSLGTISYLQAVTACMIIVFITMVMSNVIAYVIPNFLDTEYPQELYGLVQRNTEQTMEKFGAPDEEIEKALERITPDQFTPTIVSTLRGLGISLGLGLILSLIVALFVSRKSKEEPIVKTEA